MEEKNTTSYLIPGLLLTVISLAFVQQRLTRCSSWKRASVFHTSVFSVLEAKGELQCSAVTLVLWSGQVLQLPALQSTFSPILMAHLPWSSQQDWVSGAGVPVSLQVTGYLQITSNVLQKRESTKGIPSQLKFGLPPPSPKVLAGHQTKGLKLGLTPGWFSVPVSVSLLTF